MITRLVGVAAAMAPFAFALMRAVETEGRDLRYLWIAIAAFAGAMARMVLAMLGGARPMTRGMMAAGVFVMSALSAVVAAVMMGMPVRATLFVVAAAFGLCFAVSTYLRMRVR